MGKKQVIKASERPALSLPKCTLTATSLTFDESASEKDWKEAMARLASVAGASQWWIGDGLNHGEAHYGDITDTALELGKSCGACRIAKHVAAEFEPLRRRNGLPFSFHQAVASLETQEDQDELLDWAETPAEDGTLPTRKQLREKVRERKPQKEEKPFDGESAGNRLRDWLRTELDKWPESQRREAAHWIRQIIEKEFGL
jgi:hypothetical protein